jgi:glycosyltransferase involved in cell wall biosynthesis
MPIASLKLFRGIWTIEEERKKEGLGDDEVLRMLAIVHGLWRGGAQEATLEMLSLLKRRDVDVRVLTCSAADRAFLSEIKELGITVFETPYKAVSRYPNLELEKYSELVRSSDLVWVTDVEYPVAPGIKRIRKDVPVIAHLHSYALACPAWDAFYGMRECTVNCARSFGRFRRCKYLLNQYPLSLHIMSTRMRLYQLLNFPKSCLDFITWPMNERIVESIDGFVAVSRHTRDLMRTHLPQLNDVPVEAVPNAVMVPDPSSARKNYQGNRDITILYASGSNILKGPHIALYATRKLLDEGSKDFTLAMLGVEQTAWIRSLVKRLKIEGHVRLLARLPSRAQVLALMASSTAVLMPSLHPEAFGRIPVEANLLGTPAIVSNRGALPDTITDQVTGLVTEPTAEAVAKAMDEALGADWNRELISRIAKERFDPERTVDRFVHFLEKFV